MRKFYIVLLFFVTACTAANNDILEYRTLEFPVQEELTYTPVVQNIATRYVLGLFIQDSVLIVEGNDQESFFFAYSKKTGKHLKNFFKIGRGPFEGVSPKLMAINGDSCIIVESNLRKGWCFSLSGLLEGRKDFYREFRFKFPEERPQMMARIAVNLGDDRYITDIPFTARERFAIFTNPYTPGKKSVKHIYRNYPKAVQDADSVNAAVLSHINTFALSPDKTKFVNLSFIGAVAETFDFRKDTLVPIAVKGFIKPEYNILNWNAFPKNDALVGFSSVIASDNRFYALYRNYRYNSTTDIRTIAVFDWKINPVKLYTVKDMIITMALDPDTKVVYAVISNNETSEYDIVKFDKRFIE